MKNVLIFLLCGFFVISCSRDTQFVEPVPPPPVIPDPPKKPEPIILSHRQTFELNQISTIESSEKVDILWIIDNSGSMGEEQQAVIDNTAAFIEKFTEKKNLDWKIGIISTDRTQTPFAGFASLLNHETMDPITEFKTAVETVKNTTTGASDDEYVFESMKLAIDAYPNFLRDDAYLAVIMLTDEDEQSGGTFPNPTDVVSYLEDIKGGNGSVVFPYGIFTTYKLCRDGFTYSSSRFKKIMDLTNSTFFSLCQKNFGELLANIGEDLVSKIVTLQPTLKLEFFPYLGSIEVRYQGRKLPHGVPANGGYWLYDPRYNVIQMTNLNFIKGGDLKIQIDFRPLRVNPPEIEEESEQPEEPIEPPVAPPVEEEPPAN